MNKRVNSVSELLKKASLEKGFRERTEKEIREKSLSKFLFALRCDNKLTQKQLADKIGCSQSRISKIESAYDREITVKDLLDYANALGLQLELGYRTRGVKIVDLIKFHAVKIKMYLEHLSTLAQKDEALNESIGQFHDEVLFNMIKFITDSVSKLKFAKKKRIPIHKSRIHISPPIDMKEIDEIKIQN